MVGLAAYSTPPPVDIALTERSRKFYDGTYRWDSEGFTDETGVYREFDCYDPVARAPTPLPPMFLSDDGEDASSFTFASDVKHRDVVVKVRRDELFRGRADREHLFGKMEDVLISSRANKTNLTLEECCRLCVVADHVHKVDKLSNRGHTPPVRSPKKDFASPSELSDCPSDISEWDVRKPMSNTKMIRKKPIDEMFEQDDVDESKRKPTTRGVAQKVKKGAKKPTARSVKYSPAMESLQSGSYIRGTGETSRRRSTRLNNMQSGE